MSPGSRAQARVAALPRRCEHPGDTQGPWAVQGSEARPARAGSHEGGRGLLGLRKGALEDQETVGMSSLVGPGGFGVSRTPGQKATGGSGRAGRDQVSWQQRSRALSAGGSTQGPSSPPKPPGLGVHGDCSWTPALRGPLRASRAAGLPATSQSGRHWPCPVSPLSSPAPAWSPVFGVSAGPTCGESAPWEPRESPARLCSSGGPRCGLPAA